jgi:hypothetical protein
VISTLIVQSGSLVRLAILKHVLQGVPSSRNFLTLAWIDGSLHGMISAVRLTGSIVTCQNPQRICPEADEFPEELLVTFVDGVTGFADREHPRRRNMIIKIADIVRIVHASQGRIEDEDSTVPEKRAIIKKLLSSSGLSEHR